MKDIQTTSEKHAFYAGYQSGLHHPSYEPINPFEHIPDLAECWKAGFSHGIRILGELYRIDLMKC